MAGDVTHIALLPGKFAPEGGSDSTEPAVAAVVARARAGDAAAFDELMALFERRVAAIAWRMLGNEEDARDAAQEVFLKVFRHLDTYRVDDNFRAWLTRITVNVCRDAIRRRSRYERRHAALDAGSGPSAESLASPDDVEALAIAAQNRALVARALARLPERERAAFVLRDLEGLSTDETARALGTRSVTVRSQVSAARAKIRAYCERALRQGGRR